MSWAARRRFIILCIIGAVVVAFLVIVSIAAFYEAPSCSDNVLNQDETGIDCGGSCAYLCIDQQQPPTVLFTQAFSNNTGRTDIIASIENKNVAAAAKDVQYRITIFGTDQSLIQEIKGSLDLPPKTKTPVYVPGINSEKQKVVRAFLTIDTSTLRWFSFADGDRNVPLVSNTVQSGTLSAPRIEALLSNSATIPLYNVRAIVMVHDKNKNVIAASETVVRSIPAQGSATAIFTWNSAFPETPATIEVVPIIKLQ